MTTAVAAEAAAPTQPARRQDPIDTNPAWGDARAQVLASLTGRPAVVAVVGPAESGKSLLLQELLRVLRAGDVAAALLPPESVTDALVAAHPRAVLLIDEADRLDDTALRALAADPHVLVVLAAGPSFGPRLAAIAPRARIVDLSRAAMPDATGAALDTAALVRPEQPRTWPRTAVTVLGAVVLAAAVAAWAVRFAATPTTQPASPDAEPTTSASPEPQTQPAPPEPAPPPPAAPPKQASVAAPVQTPPVVVRGEAPPDPAPTPILPPNPGLTASGLPEGALTVVAIRFAEGDPAAAERATRLASDLRGNGFFVATPMPSPDGDAAGTAFLFPEDHDAAEQVARAAHQILPALPAGAERRKLKRPATIRPGAITIVVPP